MTIRRQIRYWNLPVSWEENVLDSTELENTNRKDDRLDSSLYSKFLYVEHHVHFPLSNLYMIAIPPLISPHPSLSVQRSPYPPGVDASERLSQNEHVYRIWRIHVRRRGRGACRVWSTHFRFLPVR